MKSPIQFLSLTLCVLAGVLVPGVAASKAADRLSHSTEFGSPRDLINQPLCWPPDQLDEARYCEFGQKI
jgi:hypothetical protein